MEHAEYTKGRTNHDRIGSVGTQSLGGLSF
jgi:hypothetical protein